MELYSSFEHDDLLLLYYREGNVFDFTLIPSGMRSEVVIRRQSISDSMAAKHICRELNFSFPACVAESMIQFKLGGTAFEAQHAGGTSMRNAPCTKELVFLSQEKSGDRIITKFEYGKGLFFDHIVQLCKSAVKVHTEVHNRTGRNIGFDYLASFSLGMLSPFQKDDGPDKYVLHRMQSHWAEEGRHEITSVEKAGLEMSWQAAGVRSLRYGQRSTMPVKDYFPFAGFEDTGAGVVWGAEMEAFGAWQLEFSRFCDTLNISGGQPDREFNGWHCQVKDHETFSTMPALLTCVRGDILDLFNRLVSAQTAEPVRETEKDLPVLFNEFCTTWGDPSPEKLISHIQAVKDLGLRYFVLDDGWFRKDGIQGDHGDWVLDEDKYHHDFAGFLDLIRKEGMIPGIWFEPETLSKDSLTAKAHPEDLLTLDSAPVQSGARVFLDLRRESTRKRLLEKIVPFLKKYGIGYVKTDYNSCVSCGCDGPDTPQENQRRYTEGVRAFYGELRTAMPELVIEICASGGHRLSPGWTGFADMLSFSDAHECPEVPVIALDVQMLVPMAKSQIWAVLRKGDGSRRLHYSLAAAMLGRMCLSGVPADLTVQELDIVREAVEFHKTIAPVMIGGEFRLMHVIGDHRSDPAGWQLFSRRNGGLEYVVVHTFRNPPKKISIDLPQDVRLVKSFTSDSLNWTVSEGNLEISHPEEFEGAAFLFAGKQ